MNRLFLLVALAVLLAPLSASAQILDPDRLDRMFGSEPRVEVNLRGSLLRLAAEGIRADEPDAALMLDGLNAVTVRIYSSEGASRSGFISRMADIGDEFESDGWMTMVRVRSFEDDDGETGDVWVYVRDEGDAFGGLAVMAVDEDDDDVVFVHIDGVIRPSDVAALTARFSDVDLDGEDIDYDDE